jgi:hypothetical protein
MAIFYIQRTNGTKVAEIRRSVRMNGTIRYIVDRNGGSVNFVSRQEFLSVPQGYRMNRIQ